MAIDTSYNLAGLARSELPTEFAAWADVGTHLLDQLDTAVTQAVEGDLDRAYHALQALHSALRAEGTRVPITFTAYLALRLAWIDGEQRRFREARSWFESPELRDCVESETLLPSDVYNYVLSYGVTLAMLGEREAVRAFDQAITMSVRVADYAGAGPLVHAYVATFYGVFVLEDWEGLLEYARQAQESLRTMPQFTGELRSVLSYLALKHRAYAYRGLGRFTEAAVDGETLFYLSDKANPADPNNEWRVFLKNLRDSHRKRVESGEIKIHIPKQVWYASPFVVGFAVFLVIQVMGAANTAERRETAQQEAQARRERGADYFISLVASALEANQAGDLYLGLDQSKAAELRGVDYSQDSAILIFSPMAFTNETYLSNLRIQRNNGDLQVLADLHAGTPTDVAERGPYIMVVPQSELRDIRFVRLVINGEEVSTDSLLP